MKTRKLKRSRKHFRQVGGEDTIESLRAERDAAKDEARSMRNILMRSSATGSTQSFYQTQEWLAQINVMMRLVRTGSLGRLFDDPTSSAPTLAYDSIFKMSDGRINTNMIAIAVNILTKYAIEAGVKLANDHRVAFASGFILNSTHGDTNAVSLGFESPSRGTSGAAAAAAAAAVATAEDGTTRITTKDILNIPLFNIAWRQILEPVFSTSLDFVEAAKQAVMNWYSYMKTILPTIETMDNTIILDTILAYAKKIIILVAWCEVANSKLKLVAPTIQSATDYIPVQPLTYRYNVDTMKVIDIMDTISELTTKHTTVAPIGPMLMPRNIELNEYGAVENEPSEFLRVKSTGTYTDLYDFKLAVIRVRT